MEADPHVKDVPQTSSRPVSIELEVKNLFHLPVRNAGANFSLSVTCNRGEKFRQDNAISHNIYFTFFAWRLSLKVGGDFSSLRGGVGVN